MTTDLPDPHACPHCGHNGLATRWGETICGMCNAPRATATPGCPVRNAMSDRVLMPEDIDAMLAAGGVKFLEGAVVMGEDAKPIAELLMERNPGATLTLHALAEEANRLRKSAMRNNTTVADETARERKVHGGGPRVNQGFQP